MSQSKKSKQKQNNNSVQVVSQKETVNESLTKLDLKQIDVETLVKQEQRLLKALEEQHKQQTSTKDVVENLSTVLLQALHTKDEELLYFSLEKDDEELVNNTIKNLLSSKVPTLLQFLSEAILKRPYKSQYYVSWIRGLLRQHTTILLSNACLPILQSVRNTLENRTSSFTQLLKLKGKLSAIAGIPSGRENSRQAQAKNVYVDEEVEKNVEEGAMEQEQEDYDDEALEEMDEEDIEE